MDGLDEIDGRTDGRTESVYYIVSSSVKRYFKEVLFEFCFCDIDCFVKRHFKQCAVRFHDIVSD
jgi:hypothetical protein